VASAIADDALSLWRRAMDDGAVIREVDRDRAEAVLTLRVHVPGVSEGGSEEHYLARTRPRRVVGTESVTVLPDGRTVLLETITSEEDEIVSHSTFADGVAPDGRGCGCRKSVRLSGGVDTVTIHLSMSWTDAAGERGELDGELAVPWLGAARVDLGGGRWVAGEITRRG
jgi:hypothetical protein